MHPFSISKNWKGQSTTWIPSSSGLSFAYVLLVAHLQDPISSRLAYALVSHNDFNFKDMQTWFVTNNLTRTEHLELQLVLLIQMLHVDFAPLLYVNNATKKDCEN